MGLNELEAAIIKKLEATKEEYEELQNSCVRIEEDEPNEGKSRIFFFRSLADLEGKMKAYQELLDMIKNK